MRILIYSYNYHPEPIGIAPLMTELAEGLAKRGHKVRVVTGMPNYPERRIYPKYKGKLYTTEKVNGVAVQRSYVFIRPNPSLVDRLLLDGSFVLSSFFHALVGERPEVILATVPPLPVCLPSALLGWLHGCPVVLNVQDIQHEAAVHVGLLKNKKVIRIFEALEKFAYRAAASISVIADGFVENLLGKGIPSEKIELIPNWVDVNFIRPLPKENNQFRNNNQLDGKFVVLYSGNIALTQDLRTVIKAAAMLRDIPEVVFVIVGEQQAIERVRYYCELDGADNVKVLPFQPREKLPEMLAAADVSLVTQKHNVIAFNLPSKIPVILASGRPIVASVPSTGTAAKAVQQSGGGLVVTPEDPKALAIAIESLYKNPEKCEFLGRQGRQHAMEYYSFEQALNRYEALFASLKESSKVKTEAIPKAKLGGA
ncbi:MAG TPA: glycosyltransferase family 4 protein [Leptolyngbyaceae cyanobacterium]